MTLHLTGHGSLLSEGEAPPGSKASGRGGNDGSDIAIMPYISSKAPLSFLRPCLRTDSLFSAVFALIFIIRTLLLRAGLGGAGRFSTNSNRCFRFDSRPFPSVATLRRYVRNVFPFPCMENILLAQPKHSPT